MPAPRPDGPFDVPVERIAGGRGQGRRAAIVAASIVAVLGAAFGLARLSDDGAGPDPAGASVGPLADLVSPAPSAPASAAPRRSSEPRIERLLDVADVPLAGAPRLTLVEQEGRDLRILEWTPGAGIAEVRAIPGVVGPTEPLVFPVLAPARDRVLVLAPQPGGPGPLDQARLVDASGTVLWTGGDVAVDSGGLWSEDGRRLVVTGNGRQWHLVSIDRAGVATDEVVDLPGEVFLPSPIPIGSITIPRVAPRTIPIGFSADGRWVYGGVISPELGIVIGEFRVRVDGGRVERVADFGVGRPDGLVPRPGTIGGRLVDPATGRVATWRVNPDTTGGPPTLEIREADSAFAFAVDVATPLGSAWDGNGSLYILSADVLLFPNRVTLARVGPDGSLGPPLLETGSITTAGLLDVRDGFAAIVVAISRPTSALQLVLVDLADPARITAVSLPDDLGSLVAGEVRP